MIYQIGENKKASNIVTTDVVRNSNLGDKPRYYDSMTNSPYVGRMTKGVQSKDNMLKKVTKIDRTISGTGGITETVKHGLGFKPHIIGSFYVISASTADDGERGIIGQANNLISDYVTVIASITNNEFTYNITNASAGFMEIKVRFYLLREKVLDL